MATRLIGLLTLIAMSFAMGSVAAQQSAGSAGEYAQDCRRNGSDWLLDCQCVGSQYDRMLASSPGLQPDVIFDRAAAACPSARVKANPGDPRYRHHTFEERQAIRRIALDFAQQLDGGRTDEVIALLAATPQTAQMLQAMPGFREQFEQRMREVLARRAARGKLSQRRVVAIGADHAIVQARAEVAAPGIDGPDAHVMQEVIKIAWSASGEVELSGYDFGY